MIKKIRLLHIISSLKMGGAEAVLVDLLRCLPQNEYEHHVIYFHDGPNHTHIQALGIPTYCISGLLHQYDPLFWWRLYRVIKIINPHVILSSLWAASFAARIISVVVSVPVICAVHAEIDHHGRIRNLLDYYTLSYASAIIAVSEGVVASLVKQFDAISVQKIVLIKNGIDVCALQKKQEQQSKERIII